MPTGSDLAEALAQELAAGELAATLPTPRQGAVEPRSAPPPSELARIATELARIATALQQIAAALRHPTLAKTATAAGEVKDGPA